MLSKENVVQRYHKMYLSQEGHLQLAITVIFKTSDIGHKYIFSKIFMKGTINFYLHPSQNY